MFIKGSQIETYHVQQGYIVLHWIISTLIGTLFDLPVYDELIFEDTIRQTHFAILKRLMR
jgi:hypothetical protein